MMKDIRKRIGLEDFFFNRLADIYDAERRFMKCFAALGIAAGHDMLKEILVLNIRTTQKHLGHLSAIMERFNRDETNGRCEIVGCLTEQASDLIRDLETGSPLRDVALICLVQMIQHYKIASYGNLMSLAVELNHQKVKLLIEECLVDEKRLDFYLTEIARNFINPAAI
ncbi:DUF892 family protein [Pedobacter gandavensis]|uniref:DUF892 family protein n=1 Tax=Pedobacter gandavensis TaxID=2679963 RepID=A0ABR6ETU9_9SPHI|nr:DUF892 family protein [Pedobacter gandavensis]MBB2148698.1 DUF892 family protein [Pedobacter gandavensis]